MNDDFESPIDKAIREAREKGAFDGLAGKGKPIQWSDDALVPDDQRLANQVLKNAGFTPDWIEEAREIEQVYREARARLRRASLERGAGRLGEREWQSARQAYTQHIRALNRRIQAYNLRAPSPQVQRGLYDAQPPAEP